MITDIYSPNTFISMDSNKSISANFVANTEKITTQTTLPLMTTTSLPTTERAPDEIQEITADEPEPTSQSPTCQSGTPTESTQTPGTVDQAPVVLVPEKLQPETEKYVLSIEVSGCGKATGTGVYASGEKISIVALAGDDGWYFDRWTGDIETVEDPCSATSRIILKNDCYITANFKQKARQIIRPEITAGIAGIATALLFSGFILGRLSNKKKNVEDK